MPYFSTSRNPVGERVVRGGEEGERGGTVPGVVLRVPAIIPV
jgi:hypothetical protein